MNAAVHVAALAARTPVGLVAETAAAAVRGGISRLEDHPTFTTRDGEPVCGGLDPRLDPDLRGPERLYSLAHPALAELGKKIGLPAQTIGSLPLLLALPEVRPGWSARDNAVLTDWIARTSIPGLAPFDLRSCGHGHAACLHGLGLAAQQIRAGAWELCIVGGVDSYFGGVTLSWLDTRRLLAGGDTRAGFFPGEGASFVVLASSAGLRSLGLRSLAGVRGWHSTMEVDRLMGDPEHTGKGLTEAVQSATQGLAAHERIADVYCDINGERYRSEEWGITMLRLPDIFVDATRYTAATDCWGDMGAATGALSCVLAARAWARDYANGPLALAWSGSMTGLRSAVLLEQPTQRH